MATSEAHSPSDQRELLAALALQFREAAEEEERQAAAAAGPAEAGTTGPATGASSARRSARLSGALGAANRRIISGIQVGEPWLWELPGSRAALSSEMVGT